MEKCFINESDWNLYRLSKPLNFQTPQSQGVPTDCHCLVYELVKHQTCALNATRRVTKPLNFKHSTTAQAFSRHGYVTLYKLLVWKNYLEPWLIMQVMFAGGS